MTDHVTIPREPTLDMIEAFQLAYGYSDTAIADWKERHAESIGTPSEHGLVAGLRAALAVGAGAPLEQIKRVRRPRRPDEARHHRGEIK